MGLANSKDNNANVTSNDNMSMEIVLDQGVKQQIDKLSEYVSLFNSNDVKSLLQVIDDYKMNLETTTGQKYQMTNVKNFVSKFHQELLEKIGKDEPQLSEDGKQESLKNRLKNTNQLPDYLRNIYDDSMSGLKQEVMKSPIVVKDQQMKSSLEKIFTDITGLKSKYKYFEYRYIQLNLFLIVFIQHTFNTMDKFINSVLAYTVARDRSRQDSINDLINLLLQIMRQAELNIDQKDFETIDQLMSVVEKEIKQKQVKLNHAVEKARVDALDEMLKIVVANHDMFADQTTQGMVTPKANDEFLSNFTARPSANVAAPQSVSMNPFDIQSGVQTGSAKPTMYGGFVRDHSRFPQSFYELCNKQ